jgi:hypothetical protein
MTDRGAWAMGGWLPFPSKTWPYETSERDLSKTPPVPGPRRPIQKIPRSRRQNAGFTLFTFNFFLIRLIEKYLISPGGLRASWKRDYEFSLSETGAAPRERL